MARELNELESRLLNLIQEEVPLVERPFQAIAEKLSSTEDQVIRTIQALKASGRPVVRQISAIFDTAALGYGSSLVAAKVAPDQIEKAAEVINAHPGVSHNYQRNHLYNLWYTLAVPPDSRFGLDKTVQILHRESGAIQTRLMPTLRLFKIGVKLNLGGEDIAARQQPPQFDEEDRASALTYTITEKDKQMIRVLQQDLPIEARPYDSWAHQAGVDVAQLLAAAREYVQRKQMRRFSAVLHHREAGFSANGMGIWIVPASQQEQFGKTAASFAAVSHCYLRPTYEDWPYNLFTMVHAPTIPACDQVLSEISRATGITSYSALYSSKQFKKARVKYFTPEVQQWEASHGQQA